MWCVSFDKSGSCVTYTDLPNNPFPTSDYETSIKPFLCAILDLDPQTDASNETIKNTSKTLTTRNALRGQNNHRIDVLLLLLLLLINALNCNCKIKANCSASLLDVTTTFIYFLAHSHSCQSLIICWKWDTIIKRTVFKHGFRGMEFLKKQSLNVKLSETKLPDSHDLTSICFLHQGFYILQ